MRPVIWMVYINMFLYATCYLIQTNTLPYLTKTMNPNPVVFGYLQSVVSILQLVGGLVYGRFGDMFGSHLALTVAFIAASLYYGLLAISFSVPLLFLSSLPVVFMHAMQGGHMIITDLTDESERTDVLGKLWFSYAVGSVMGPFIGGYTSTHFSHHTSAALASFGSLTSVLLVWLFIPATKTKEPHSPVPGSDSDADTNIPDIALSSGLFSISKMMSVIKRPGVGMLLLARILTGFPSGIFSAMFPVVTMNTFDFTPEQNGYVLSYVSVLSMIAQGFTVGFLTKRFTEQNILKWCFFIFSWSYLLMSFSRTVVQICISMTPTMFGMSLLTVIISSSLTKLVPAKDTGMVLSFSMATDALIGTVAPTVGGYLLKRFSYQSFGCIGVICNAIAFVVYLFVRPVSCTVDSSTS